MLHPETAQFFRIVGENTAPTIYLGPEWGEVVIAEITPEKAAQMVADGITFIEPISFSETV